MNVVADVVRGRRGQVFPLVAVLMTSLIGITAFVVDVGSWDRDHRSLQAVADAAALAGAEDLPYDQPGASALATSYATRNGGGTLSIAYPRSDTIQVTMSNYAPGKFAAIYGAQNQSVHVSAQATARAVIPSQTQGVVPLVVSSTQPQLTGCSGSVCFGTAATLKINDDTTLGGGQAGLIDLRTNGDGSVTAQQIADWVTNGLSSAMPANRYYSSAGSCKFSNQSFHTALDAKVVSGTPLLFPVYDPSRTDTTTNPPRYYILGWSAFLITSYRLNGCGNKSDFIAGHFVHLVARGTWDGTATADYGVRVVALVG